MSATVRAARVQDAAVLVPLFYVALGFEDWCPTSERFVREL